MHPERIPSFQSLTPIGLIAPAIAGGLIAAGGGILSALISRGGSGGQGQALTGQSAAQIDQANQLAARLKTQLGVGGAAEGGLRTLNQIIRSQGQTDPAAFNRTLIASGRDTEANVRAAEDRLARLGLQGSLQGQGNLSAIEAGGADRLAGLRADEVALAEARKRDDILLLVQALINPSINLGSVGTGAGIAGAQIGAQQSAAAQQQQAAILQSIISALGQQNFGGGGGGATTVNVAPPNNQPLFPVSPTGGGCWVARAVYGEDDPRWLLARVYVLELAPDWFRRFYIRFGERIAAVVSKSLALKRVLRPIFDRFVQKATRHRGLG